MVPAQTVSMLPTIVAPTESAPLGQIRYRKGKSRVRYGKQIRHVLSGEMVNGEEIARP